MPPVLACFNDADSKVRYFACESMYNVVSRSSLSAAFRSARLSTSSPLLPLQAKVAKGEILIFFNELFDAMSKVSSS